jgi:hypothetical protein
MTNAAGHARRSSEDVLIGSQVTTSGVSRSNFFKIGLVLVAGETVRDRLAAVSPKSDRGAFIRPPLGHSASCALPRAPIHRGHLRRALELRAEG